MRYERTHGVHNFTMRDKTLLTAISAPNWPEYIEALESLPDTKGYVVSPELITATGPLELIPRNVDVISSRGHRIEAVSRSMPGVIMLVGTATFGKPKPCVSVVTYESGLKVGQQDKKITFSKKEKGVFGFDDQQSATLNTIGKSLLICADLIGAAGNANVAQKYNDKTAQEKLERFISPAITSLILVSCWGVPHPHHNEGMMTREERYRGTLERCVVAVMKSCLNLQEIIMVDRAIPASGTQPYNAHFKRAA